MTIREGTLVTRYNPTQRTNPCEEYVDWTKHAEAGTPGIMEICIGVVIEAIPNNSDVTLNWLQMCPHHHNEGIPVQESPNFWRIYEVGQLA